MEKRRRLETEDEDEGENRYLMEVDAGESEGDTDQVAANNDEANADNVNRVEPSEGEVDENTSDDGDTVQGSASEDGTGDEEISGYESVEYENNEQTSDEIGLNEYESQNESNGTNDETVSSEENEYASDNSEGVERGVLEDDVDQVGVNEGGAAEHEVVENGENNNIPEIDLLTDEEAEIANEGPSRPLFQGIRENAGLNIPLTCKEGITDIDHFLVTLAMGLRFGLSYENILFQLNWIKNSHENSNLPVTKEKMWKLLGRDKQNTVCRLYCSVCKEKIGHGSKASRDCFCGRCGPEKAETYVDTFIQIRLRPQLEELLNLPNMGEALKYKFRREKIDPHAIEDIYDGKNYKNLEREGKFLAHPFNYSLTLWTDGVKLTNSSTVSAYPIFLHLNELHPYARKKHLILAGIWVGIGGPAVLNTILQPVVRDLQLLNNQGVTWRDGEAEITSRFIVNIFTADSIARPNACRMKQFNGECGCTVCIAPGELFERNLRVYPAQPFPLRTDADIRRDAAIAFHTKTPVNGVKGCSALAGLPLFDLVDGVAVDVGHMGWEGIAKQFFTRIMTDVGEAYYIGQPVKLKLIDERLLQIKTPSRLSRTPRSIALWHQWKGSEWRNWVLYYSLFCLQGILDLEYFELWRKFVQAIFILNNSSITVTDLDEAEYLINLFIEGFETLFGPRHMSFNIHLLRHAPACVRNWGPLWAYSTFPFESSNQDIVKAVTSPNHRAEQIITRFLMRKFIITAAMEVEIAEETEIAIEDLLIIPRVNVPQFMVEGHYFVGQGKETIRRPSEQEFRLIRNARFPVTAETELHLYERAIIHGSKYRVVDNEDRKTCDCVVYSRTGFWKISKLMRFEDQGITICGFIGKKMIVRGNLFLTHFIQLVTASEQEEFISYSDVIVPGILIAMSDMDFCAVSLSNSSEMD